MRLRDRAGAVPATGGGAAAAVIDDLPNGRRDSPASELGRRARQTVLDQKPYFALLATSCFVMLAAASSRAALASFLPVTVATAACPAPWGPKSASPAAGIGGKKRASCCCSAIAETPGSPLNSAEL